MYSRKVSCQRYTYFFSLLYWSSDWCNWQACWPIPCQLQGCAPQHLFNFFLFLCGGRYWWESKILKIWASYSISFSRGINLKFRGVSVKNVSQRERRCLEVHECIKGTIYNFEKYVFWGTYLCRIQIWHQKTCNSFTLKDIGPSKCNFVHPGPTFGGSELQK